MYGREADVYSFGVCLWSLITLQVGLSPADGKRRVVCRSTSLTCMQSRQKGLHCAGRWRLPCNHLDMQASYMLLR